MSLRDLHQHYHCLPYVRSPAPAPICGIVSAGGSADLPSATSCALAFQSYDIVVQRVTRELGI